LQGTPFAVKARGTSCSRPQPKAAKPHPSFVASFVLRFVQKAREKGIGEGIAFEIARPFFAAEFLITVLTLPSVRLIVP